MTHVVLNTRRFPQSWVAFDAYGRITATGFVGSELGMKYADLRRAAAKIECGERALPIIRAEIEGDDDKFDWAALRKLRAIPA